MKILLCFLLLLKTLASYDILFILHDATETQSLWPVIDVSLRNHEDIFILTGGQASDILSRQPCTLTFEQTGICEHLDKMWKRDELLSQKSLQLLVEKFPAKKVITGVSYAFYGQLLEAYASHHATTFAYWDNINYEGIDHHTKICAQVAQLAQVLLTSAPPSISHPQTYTVGQPALEQLLYQINDIDSASIRAHLPFILKSPILVVFGGYGKAYHKALKPLLLTAESLPATILLYPHPRTDGTIERKKLLKYSLPHVHIIDPTWNLSMLELAAIADHIICHQSSAGFQAAAAGKNIIYWTPPGQTYSNHLIEKGYAQATNLEELKKFLETPVSKNFFETLQLPPDSIRTIYNLLHL
jgi:hypothetical protein